MSLRAVGMPLSLEDSPDPAPAGDEVVVRVNGAGVCHTDVHIQDGLLDVPLPLVLGHEIAGVAEGHGPVARVRALGRRHVRLLCRGRRSAVRGRSRTGPCSPRRPRGRGGRAVGAVPRPLEGLDPVRAAPLADAGVTPYRAVRRAQPWLAEGGAAVVLGAGALGQFAIQYLKRLPGVRVVAVDPAPVKQQIARDLGADAVPLEGADAALDRVRRGEVAGRLVLTP